MRIRTAPVVVAAIALLATGSLTACSQPATTNACEPTLESGALSKNVTVLGGFGTEPTISIPNDITVPSAQVTTIDAAEDRSGQITEPSVVSMNYALYESSSGGVLEQSEDFTSGQGGDFIPVLDEPGQGSIPDGLLCAAPGDRLVVVFSPEESEMISGSIGAPADTSIIGVVDVHAVTPYNLPGRAKVLPTGFPGVVTNNEGRPGVVVAPGQAPSKTRVATRIEGPGASISEEDRVIANVLTVDWNGTPLSNTWDSTPTMLINGEDGNNHPVREHLNGQAVGSQVVVITPDAEGTTTVNVVDILAAG